MANLLVRVWLPDRPGAGKPIGEVLSIGGRVISRDGLLFDPEVNTWERIPRSSVSGRDGMARVWTGDEIIAWGGVSRGWRGSKLHDDGMVLVPPQKAADDDR